MTKKNKKIPNPLQSKVFIKTLLKLALKFYPLHSSILMLIVCSTIFYNCAKSSDDSILGKKPSLLQLKLYYAIDKGNVEEAKKLIEKVDNVNFAEGYGTPLVCAIARGQLELAQLLLEHGADPNLGYWNKTPMHIAAFYGQHELIPTLMTYGASISSKDSIGRTPLHFSAGVNCGPVAEESKEFCIKMKINQSKFAEDLLALGADINAQDDNNGWTPLHTSAYGGHQQTCQVLLDHQADTKVRDKKGQTPLHIAAHNGRLEIVSLLIRYGSEINVRDNSGQTPLHLSAYTPKINLKEEVGVAFHKYCLENQIEIAKLLLSRGADINAEDNQGHTPLFIATENNHTGVINILQENGGISK